MSRSRPAIGFFGNVNNHSFVLARALRGMGHDVRFLVDRPERLHRPEFRYRDVSIPYPSWIEEVPTIEIEDVVYRTRAWQQVLKRLAGLDGVVLSSLGIAAARELDAPAVCLTTGADLEIYANPDAAEAYARNAERQSRPRDWVRGAFRLASFDLEELLPYARTLPTVVHRTIRRHVFSRFTELQGLGLRAAVAVSYFPRGAVEVGDRLLDRWRSPGARREFFMMADTDWIAATPLPHNAVPRLFNPTRWDWCEPFPPLVGAWENKRNDILVRGIAEFHRRSGRVLDVQFVEKGQSTEATKALVRDLGLGSMVTWRAEMSQAEVFEEYRRADIVGEQMGDHVVALAGYEAMATGRPVIANWRPEIFGPAFGTDPPVAQARTVDDVAHQLERLMDGNVRRELARRGRRFVERHLSPRRVAGRVVELLELRPGAVRPRPPVAA